MTTMAPDGGRILVIDDEPVVVDVLRDVLGRQGYDVSAGGDAAACRRLIDSAAEWDLLLLDVMLPDADGMKLCQTIRSESDIPIVMLTARGGVPDRVLGLEFGADDYVPKPFEPRELVARVEAQFRRRDMEHAPPPRLELPEGIEVDLARLEVHRNGDVIPLTPREGDILEYLVRNRHRVVTRDDLLLDVWHYRSANVETRTVDIHIVGLRRKVEPNPSDPTLIQTVRGKGYRIVRRQESHS